MLACVHLPGRLGRKGQVEWPTLLIEEQTKRAPSMHLGETAAKDDLLKGSMVGQSAFFLSLGLG